MERSQVGWTVDERVTSGFYFIKSMLMLQDYMNHPEWLETVPEIPKDTITKAEYKAQLKEKKRQKKLAKKQAKAEKQ